MYTVHRNFSCGQRQQYSRLDDKSMVVAVAKRRPKRANTQLKVWHRSLGLGLRESLIASNHVGYHISAVPPMPLNFAIWVFVVYDVREHDVMSSSHVTTRGRYPDTDQQVEIFAEKFQVWV
jgi:hypothetical protein